MPKEDIALPRKGGGYVVYRVDTHVADLFSWLTAYNKGLQAADYPVPAHRYNVIITRHVVEIIVGVRIELLPGSGSNNGAIYEADTVFYTDNFNG